MKGNRHQVNSQLAKGSNAAGLKTPLISDKMTNKKQTFAMTPDIHTKTYHERSSIGVIVTGPIAGGNQENFTHSMAVNNSMMHQQPNSNMGMYDDKQ